MIGIRNRLMPLVAAVLCLSLWSGTGTAAQTSPEVTSLATALESVRSGDWDKARNDVRRAGSLARDIIEWHRLRAGQGEFDEVVRFLERRPDWPGLPFLRERSEQAVPFGSRAEDVLAFFGRHEPETGRGSLALAAALERVGRIPEAQELVARAWRTQNLSPADESLILQRWGETVRPHHVARLDDLLWRGQEAQARRMFERVPQGWRNLGEARIALRQEANGVDGLIAAVPADLTDDPGLAFERFRWRAAKGRNEAAIELVLERGPDGLPLGRPEVWADWRTTLARWAMRNGSPRNAYRLAALHGLADGADYAELEWLAGYIALTYLADPERALGHFRAFRIAVATPISLGRAGYWEGRAAEALGRRDDAYQAYAFGAEHQTSFYGLLAAERAGIAMDPRLAGTERPGDWRQARFTGSSVFEAGEMLLDAGERALAERFLTHLAESLDETAVAQLAEYALQRDEPHVALMIAKRAAQTGMVVPRAYFPVVDLGVSDPRVPLEMALAVARRESEFDPGVTSGVGARGLMQVMPGTAKEVAETLDIEFDRSRLLSDPVYNATIGKAYLAELIATFGPNMALVAAGYNAGPSRPIRWIEERGDPRVPGTDPIDWIEHIPFTETRNYVMRVMESLPIYRARLSGRTEPIRLSEELAAP